jgi:hypothetical protein
MKWQINKSIHRFPLLNHRNLNGDDDEMIKSSTAIKQKPKSTLPEGAGERVWHAKFSNERDLQRHKVIVVPPPPPESHRASSAARCFNFFSSFSLSRRFIYFISLSILSTPLAFPPLKKKPKGGGGMNCAIKKKIRERDWK